MYGFHHTRCPIFPSLLNLTIVWLSPNKRLLVTSNRTHMKERNQGGGTSLWRMLCIWENLRARNVAGLLKRDEKQKLGNQNPDNWSYFSVRMVCQPCFSLHLHVQVTFLISKYKDSVRVTFPVFDGRIWEKGQALITQSFLPPFFNGAPQKVPNLPSLSTWSSRQLFRLPMQHLSHWGFARPH